MKGFPNLQRPKKKPAPSSFARTQRNAWLLSLAGFLPFGVLAGSLFFTQLDAPLRSFVIGALAAYGAVILAFLGGIRWGLALQSASEAEMHWTICWSTVPSLVGWFSLYLDAPLVFVVQALAFAGQGAWDVISGERGAFALWFARLRVVLTFLVTGALILAFFATI